MTEDIQTNSEPEKEDIVTKLQNDMAVLTDDLKRTAADYENYRKRVERDQQAIRAWAMAAAVKQILAPLDNFEVALQHTANHEEFVTGMQMIQKELQNALISLGLQKVDCLGKLFDPQIHQAVEYVPSDQPEGTIVGIIRPGYLLNGIVIRPAQVKLAEVKKNG